MNRINSNTILNESIKKHSTRFGCSTVKPKNKFIQIIIKVLSTTLMCSQQPSLKQGCYRITFGKKIFSNKTFFFSNFMSIAKSFQFTISFPSIRYYCTAWLNSFFYRQVQTIARSIGYAFEPYAANTLIINLCCNYNQKFTVSASSPFASFFASNIRFINFDCSGNTIATRSNHCVSESIQPFPSRMITAYSKSSLKSQSDNPMFLIRHRPHSPKPQLKWFFCILEYCFYCYRTSEATFSTFIQLTIHNPCFVMFTSRTLKTITPANVEKIVMACLFRIKSFLKFHYVSQVVFHTHTYYILGLGQSSA